jgi:hypothetical protein
MATTRNSTTDLDRRLVALVSDLKGAEGAAEGLDDDIAFDLGCLLNSARASLSKARDLVDKRFGPPA